MTIQTKEDYKAAAEALIDSGIRRIFISMGPDGILAATKDEMYIVGHYPASVKCTTGAGDSANDGSYLGDGSTVLRTVRTRWSMRPRRPMRRRR